MRVTSGESEPERRRRTPLPLVSPRSTKEKKRAVRPSTRSPDEPEKIPRYSCVLGVREFMAVLAVIGPLGTLISLWVLPQGELMDQLPSMRARHMRNRGEGASRVIHLTMADNERKARFVLGADLDWDQFIGGVQERLQLASIARIETEAGEGIMSVEDLMHEDHLVIYSDAPLKRRERGSLLFRSEEEEDLDEDYDDEFESRGRRGPRRRVRPADALASEEPDHHYVKSFTGFECIILNPEVAWDGQTSFWLVEQGNTTNSLGVGMHLCDKIKRAKEPSISYSHSTTTGNSADETRRDRRRSCAPPDEHPAKSRSQQSHVC